VADRWLASFDLTNTGQGIALTFTTSNAEDGAVRLCIKGELDILTVSELRETITTLVALAPRLVEVDLSGLRMIDSTGIGALIALTKGVRAAGGNVTVTGLNGQPQMIFKLLRLDR